MISSEEVVETLCSCWQGLTTSPEQFERVTPLRTIGHDSVKLNAPPYKTTTLTPMHLSWKCLSTSAQGDVYKDFIEALLVKAKNVQTTKSILTQ